MKLNIPYVLLMLVTCLNFSMNFMNLTPEERVESVKITVKALNELNAQYEAEMKAKDSTLILVDTTCIDSTK